MKMNYGKICKGALCVLLSTAMSVNVFAMPSDGYGHWAQTKLDKWYNYGYLRGYPDGLLHPNGQITRAEFVTLANSAMGYTQNAYISFSDVPKSFWGYNQIASAVAAGYVSGDRGGKFRPYTPITRQEAAVMVARMCRLGNNAMAAAGYKDGYQIPSWAKGAIGAVKVAGMMSGYKDGTFRPNAPLSRAEAVVLLDHALPYGNQTTPSYRPTTPTPMPMPVPIPQPQQPFQPSVNGQDYTLEDTSLKNKTITGDLIISSRIGSKTVKLDDVKVLGKVRIEGGSTIEAKDCTFKEVIMDKKDVKLESDNSSIDYTKFASVGRISGDGFDEVVIDKSFSSDVEIDAEVDQLVLNEETDIKLLSKADIDTFEVKKYADHAEIAFSHADVNEMDVDSDIRITGKGTIKKMTVHVDGVRSSIKPDRVYTKGDGEKPTYTDDDDIDSDDLENLQADKDKTYRGDYRNVTVTEDGVVLENMKVHERLTIDDKVRDGGVTLHHVTVKGYTNIEGGGDRSIRFEDCEFEKDIIVDKTRSGDQVVVKFDDKTLKNLNRTVEIEGNGAIIKRINGTGVLPKAKIATTRKVEFNLPVKYLEVAKDNNDIVLTEKVEEIHTNTKINIRTSGNGAVEKFSGTGNVTINGQPLAKITLSETELKLAKGQSKQLTATVTPASPVEWSSDNLKAATVDKYGNVKAVAPGVAKITAKAGNTIAVCTVTVSESSTPMTEEITISAKEPMTEDGMYILYVGGDTVDFKATVKPDTADQFVTWKSSNSECVEVNENSGQVTIKQAGKATITATATDGSNQTKNCEVVVLERPTKVEVAVVNDADPKVSSGGTLTLEVRITQENPDNIEQPVLWSVDSNVPHTIISDDGKLSAGTVAFGESAKEATVTAQVGKEKGELKITIEPEQEAAKKQK